MYHTLSCEKRATNDFYGMASENYQNHILKGQIRGICLLPVSGLTGPVKPLNTEICHAIQLCSDHPVFFSLQVSKCVTFGQFKTYIQMLSGMDLQTDYIIIQIISFCA